MSLTDKRSIDVYTRETVIPVFPLDHVLHIRLASGGHPATMEGDGLRLCQTHNIITKNQIHTSYEVKLKKTSGKWHLVIVLKVPKIS